MILFAPFCLLVLSWVYSAPTFTLNFGHLADDGSAYSGIASDVKAGIQLAFDQYNAVTGTGFCGKPLALVSSSSTDSNYTLRGLDLLVNSNVFGFVGVLGPSSIAATTALSTVYNVANLAPISGSRTWRSSFSSPLTSVTNVLHLRISQADEALLMVQYLRYTRSIQLISLVYDTSPSSFFESSTITAIEQACSRTGVKLLDLVGVDSTTMTFAQLSSWVATQPFVATTSQLFAQADRAFLVIAPPSFAAALALGIRSVLALSTIGVICDGDVLSFSRSLGTSINFSDILVSQITPPTLALDPDVAAVLSSSSASTISSYYLEGYAAGKLLTLSLTKVGSCTTIGTPEALLGMLLGRSFGIANATVGPYTTACNQGLRQTWIRVGSSNNNFSFLESGQIPSRFCSADPAQLGPKVLVFGQSTNLEVGGTGFQLKAGIQAAFMEQNRKGGVNGHLLQLISMDDTGDFATSQSNTQSLLNLGVIGLMGYSGSEMSFMAASLANATSVPLLAPLSGSDVLRTSSLPNIVNVRASETDEINALANFLLDNFDVTAISIFYQNDSFGSAGVTSLEKALAAANLHLLSKGTFLPGSNDVITSGLNPIFNDAAPMTPQAIFVWAPATQASQFILAAEARNLSNLIFLCSSAVGDLFPSLVGSAKSVVYVAQPFPLPSDFASAIVQNYRSAMTSLTASYTPSSVSLEAYISARLIISVCSRIASLDSVTPSDIIQSIRDSSIFRLQELTIGPYSAQCNQGMKKIWIYQTKSGAYSPPSSGSAYSLPSFDFSGSGTCISGSESIKTKILLFAQSAPFTGSLGNLGPALRSGFIAAFAEQDQKGGVSGYKLRVTSLDDTYQKAKALVNTNIFIRQNVYGLTGYYGADISSAVAEYINASGLPFISPRSGSSSLRGAFPNFMMVRTTYSDEVYALAKFVLSRFPITAVSIFYQGDSFGSAGLDALVLALQASNIRLLSNGTYFTSDLQTYGLNPIINNAAPFVPEAIFIWATVASAISFIQLARQRPELQNTIYLCTSAVGEGFLAAFVNNNLPNLYVAQAMPLTTDTNFRIVQDYHNAMRMVDPNYAPGMFSLEAYINGRFLVECLKRIPPDNISDFHALPRAMVDTSVFVLNGFTLGPYLETCNQGLKKVWLSQVVNAQYQSLLNDTFSFESSGTCISDASAIGLGFLIFGQSSSFTGPLAHSGPEIRSGLLAAFEEVNAQGGVFNHKLRLISLDDGYRDDRALNNTQSLFSRDVHSLLGYVGTNIAEAVAPVASSAGFPFISPSSGSATIRIANLTTIGIRASYIDEVNALLHFAVSHFGFLRYSIFYQTDSFGNDGKVALTKALAAIGESILSSGNYSVATNDVDSGLNDILKDGSMPQAIFVWAISAAAAPFINAALARLPPEVIFLCASVVGDSSFLSVINRTATNIYVAQILPPLKGSTHPLVLRYIESFQAYNSSLVPSLRSYESYVNARLMITVLQRMTPSTVRSRSKFLDAFYTNSIFSMDTLTIGPYVRGKCNQGLRQVWIGKFDIDGFFDMPSHVFDFTGSCFSNPNTTLFRPIIFGFVMDWQSENAYHIYVGLSSILEEANGNGGVSGRTFHLVLIDSARVANESILETYVRQNGISAFISTSTSSTVATVLSNFVQAKGLMVITPTRLGSTLVQMPMNANSIAIGGSRLDEAYAIARYLGRKLGVTRIAGIYESGDTADEAIQIVKQVAEFFDLTSGLVLSITTDLDVPGAVNTIATDRTLQAVVVTGTTAVVTEFVLQLKLRSPLMPVYIIRADLKLAALQTSFPNLNGIFITRFDPPITVVANQFNVHCRTALSALNSSYTPSLASGQGCLMGGLLVETVKYSEKVLSSVKFSTEALYTLGLFTIDGFRLGPFVNSTCQLRRSVGNCECDQGIHTVWMVELTPNASSPFRLVDDATLDFDTCGVVLTAKTKVSSESFPSFVIGIICAFAFVVVVVAVIAIRMAVARRRRSAEALSRAPRGFVTIVFTDVQYAFISLMFTLPSGCVGFTLANRDSTKLWDTCHGMKDALETHNRVMRRLIEKHKGYEVKTQGDSFMVAFTSALAAVEWSLDVQEDLMYAEWPMDILVQESCAVLESPEAEEGQMAYLFRGLRVRIGIHSGYPEVEYNPRTNSVDYFGPCVNGAARIEALGAGGQVLLSVETYAHLGQITLKNVVFTPMGKYPLKGMITEQEIIQVSSRRLATRTFPPLDHKRAMEDVSIEKGQAMCVRCHRPVECLRCRRMSLGLTDFVMSPRNGGPKQDSPSGSLPGPFETPISPPRLSSVVPQS